MAEADHRKFVIVGAGQAGRWVALTLRDQGYTGRIVWFGDEGHAPYDRPPLSKAVIQGDVAMAQLALLNESQRATLACEERYGDAVVAIDRARRVVRTAGGDEVGYDALFLATGGRARMLPGLAPHPRVATLRTHADALAIKRAMAESRRVLVIGGGWIGLEIAASARKLGREVTLIEAAPRLCIRTVPACVGEHLLALHRGQGVDVRLGDGVARVDAASDAVRVALAGGDVIEGDFLVVGIGLVANDALAAEAGLATGNGVLTDACGRTDDPAIYAVGDVAHALRDDGTRLRIESWENAQRQAQAAARAALGLAPDADADAAPWFWSDQYDDNLQLLGLPAESHRIVERVVPARRQRLFFFCEGHRVRAVAAVNAGREIKVARKWMQQDRYPAIETLADTATELHKLPLAAA